MGLRLLVKNQALHEIASCPITDGAADHPCPRSDPAQQLERWLGVVQVMYEAW